MAGKEGSVATENKATYLAKEHNSGRMRDIWKRISMLGFGGALASLIIGGLISSAAVTGWGLVAGLGVGAAGLIGQGFSRK